MKTKFNGILTLLLAFVVQLTFAQEKTISGTVVDETNMPLPGATVVIKGTTTGASTDFDGNYSISANSGDVLMFSYVGYTDQSVTVGSSNVINLTMKENAAELDAVVVTAFGIKREKRSTTYQTESVDSELMNDTQPQTVAQGLTGKVAGLQINTQNNGVNPSTKINLRGFRSITGGSSALIVIDGAIASQGAFNALNPNDVDSVNVLKGATAAALYGSEAGNGVLIVTTKKGDIDGKFKVGFQSSSVFTEVSYMPKFQTEYGTGWEGEYDTIENTNWGPRFDGTIRPVGPVLADGSQQMLPYAPVKNNLKDFYNTGSSFKNTAYFSGGNKTSSYYLSLGQQENKGIVPGDRYKRTNFRVNASKKLGKLELSLNSSYFKDKTSVVGSTIGAQDRNLYWFILNTPANIPLSNYKDWRNNKFATPDGYFNGYYENPYYALDNNRDNDTSTRLTANIAGAYEVTKWLNLSARLGINQVAGNGKEWRNAQTYTSDYSRPNAITSFVTDTQFNTTTYTTNVLANMNFDLTDDFALKSTLGAANKSFSRDYTRTRANNLSIPGFYDISNGTGELDGLAINEQEKTYGYFADVNIGFRNYLFLNASGRYDWTSTLPEGENSYFYPAVGMSFVASDALDFIKDSDVISYAKITASNSTVYNDLGIGDYNETYGQATGFSFGSLNGFVLSNTAVDSEIKKEKINSTEFGLNLSFFKNRIKLDASYFTTDITDLIVTESTPYSSAAAAKLTNIGLLENKGLELSLSGSPVKNDNFKWNVAVNYSANETIVKEANVQNTAINTYTGIGIYASVGEAFPQLRGTSYERSPNGSIVIDPATGRPIIGGEKSLGKTTPDYILGLNNTFEYKNLSLSATMDYRTGHVYYSQLADAMEFTGRSMESVSSNRQDFIFPNSVVETSPGVYTPNTNIPVQGGRQSFWTGDYNEIKENYVRDATALKLREVSLRYKFNDKILGKSPISSLSVAFIANNVLTFLPEENRFSDPEFNNASASDSAVGASGFNQSPPTRSYGLNLNIEF